MKLSFLRRQESNIESNIKTLGRVVQLDRISDFGSEGWGFESSRGH